MIVLLAGIVLRATAILSLGKAFSSNVAIRSNQKIYRGGLYRFAAPSGLHGLLAVVSGLGIEVRNWLGLLCAVRAHYRRLPLQNSCRGNCFE